MLKYATINISHLTALNIVNLKYDKIKKTYHNYKKNSLVRDEMFIENK